MNHAIIAKYIVEVEELIRKLEQEFPDSIHYFTTPCFLHVLFTRTLNRLKLEMLPAEAREALNKIAFLHKTPTDGRMFSTHVRNLPLDKLHPDLDKRLLFYKRVLGPVGHANSGKLGWWVSEDYIHALETDPEPLRALLKLLYDEH